MDLSRHKQWHAREYHRCVYERALDQYEDRPDNANLVYELIWAFTEAEAHPMPDGAVPLAAFPLDCYDLLISLPEGALLLLPRTALAVAIGWTRGLLKKLALERARPVVMFEEGDRDSGSRMVVYFGGNQFFSFATLLEWRPWGSCLRIGRLSRVGTIVTGTTSVYKSPDEFTVGIRAGRWPWSGNPTRVGLAWERVVRIGIFEAQYLCIAMK
ncbi:hypothetical protein F5876DRAFT_66926 [Lentinula aff. lateritia]|uniref:Uncharacterized protein n=1 Tax=Lentinula aff. lateritia TaxID=2804960 RepID=A0ACC1TWA0_9AGAR|nr:hypothetical protein F5876DRAFT_66926 [Lentinula aff. lateritia]